MNRMRLASDRCVALRSRTKVRFAHRALRSKAMRTRFVAGLPDRDDVLTVDFS
jgi:hypothetical protein